MNRLFLTLLASLIFLSNLKINGQENLKGKLAFEVFLKKTDLDKKKFIVEYMYNFNNDVYEKFHQDEFEFHSKKNEEYDKLNSRFQNISDSSVFLITTDAKFGEYNFDNESFDFIPLQENSYFRLHYTDSHCSKCLTDTEINISFNNTNDFSGLEIPNDFANNLIKSRKSDYGDVDRNVIIKVYFTVDNKINIENTSNDNYVIDLLGNIIKIEVYDIYGTYTRKGTGRILAIMTK